MQNSLRKARPTPNPATKLFFNSTRIAFPTHRRLTSSAFPSPCNPLSNISALTPSPIQTCLPSISSRSSIATRSPSLNQLPLLRATQNPRRPPPSPPLLPPESPDHAQRRHPLPPRQRTRQAPSIQGAFASRSHQGLSRPLRKTRAQAQRLCPPHTGNRPRRSRSRPKRDRARSLSRPAARNSLRRKRSARCEGSSDNLGSQALRKSGFRLRRHGHRTFAPRRRHSDRQSRDDRTCRRNELPLRVSFAAERRKKSLEHFVLDLRFVVRLRRNCCGGARRLLPPPRKPGVACVAPPPFRGVPRRRPLSPR